MSKQPPPRNFFLNEAHELAHTDQTGGGRPPNLGKINWSQRGSLLSKSLVSARTALLNFPDPTVNTRLFLLARPVAGIPKVSESKKSPGPYSAKPDFGGAESLAFRRLGVDLLEVGATGEAVVHTTPQRFERLVTTAASLATEGIREQARWVAIERFDVVPPELKYDNEWLDTLPKTGLNECVLRFHSLLTRSEVESVLSLIADSLKSDGEKIVRAGLGFSGRRWYLAHLQRKTIERVARDFASVQALHPPMRTPLAAGSKPRGAPAHAPASVATFPLPSLPTVAVVDCGVPQNHPLLGGLIRGRYSGRSSGPVGHDHASLVASRIAFGDLNLYGGPRATPPPECAIVDVAVADQPFSNQNHVEIYDDDVVDAMIGVLSGNPEVRVFNLSFGNPEPVGDLPQRAQEERLIYAQDLDNFCFAHDSLVVLSAGNTALGVQPQPAYPGHQADPRWGMGGWASGTNTLKVGAYVGFPVPQCVASTVGWPSPFSRVGPPISGAAAPEFSAPGGDLRADYNRQPLAGVWGCNSIGLWDDHPGTSFAAPIISREAALAFERLRGVAGRPFAVLVRAFLAQSARRLAEQTYTAAVQRLADRTLGLGLPDARSIVVPSPDEALLFWQGVLDGPGDTARVQVFIPAAWLAAAKEPTVRLVVCWDPPTNHAVRGVWRCREVAAKLKPTAGAETFPSMTKERRRNSPQIDRLYDLSQPNLVKKKVAAADDAWVVELSYSEVAPYPPGLEFSPTQRVAFVAKLFDRSIPPVSPQATLQGLRAAQSMTRLSAATISVPATVLVRVRSS